MTDYIGGVLPTDWIPENSMIKVIGVGGGGCNAVTYMYNQKIQGCNFIVCNTDSQALAKSNVRIKVAIGDGLGAGTDPSKARKAATESQEDAFDYGGSRRRYGYRGISCDCQDGQRQGHSDSGRGYYSFRGGGPSGIGKGQ